MNRKEQLVGFLGTRYLGFKEKSLVIVADALLSVYAKHDKSRNEYQKTYQLDRYHKRMKDAKKILGGKCSSCGSKRKLELDHKDPSKKDFTLTKLWGVAKKDFENEVKKCRLLCNSCHKDNTAKQREDGTVKSVPGKTKYKNNRRKKSKKKAGFERLASVLASLSFKDAASTAVKIGKAVVASHPDLSFRMASDFKKSEFIERPVITWNVFKKEDKQQILFRVYGQEKDADEVKKVVASVLEAVRSADVKFDYEADLSEPGLVVKTISGLC